MTIDPSGASIEVVVGWVLFGVGWTLGWLLLWSTRSLPTPGAARRAPVAIVVPARNESNALPNLLAPLRAQCRIGDELVVVDDHSTDATAAVARSFGATVVQPPLLPPGWVGKAHACWHGAGATHAELLVFLDADVCPGPGLLGGLAEASGGSPGAVVSMQPWHDAVTVSERASALPNVVSLMGSGGFTALGRRVPTNVAYGPVLAIPRADYDRVGGHAHPDVRASLTEDIQLARLVGRSQLFSGRADATFRMYPRGLGELLAGWSRTMAAGVAATRWWVALAIVAWVWSLAGGWVVSWWAYPLSAVQVWVLGRRAGRFGPGVAALYPLAVLALLAVVAGAVANRVRGRTTWRGRPVTAS